MDEDPIPGSTANAGADNNRICRRPCWGPSCWGWLFAARSPLPWCR